MSDSSEEEGTLFWFMAIQAPHRGVWLNDYQGTWVPEPGDTRMDCLNAIRQNVDDPDPRARGGIVIAFDIQPNKI